MFLATKEICMAVLNDQIKVKAGTEGVVQAINGDTIAVIFEPDEGIVACFRDELAPVEAFGEFQCANRRYLPRLSMK
jgi:hypothetical protein